MASQRTDEGGVNCRIKLPFADLSAFCTSLLARELFGLREEILDGEANSRADFHAAISFLEPVARIMPNTIHNQMLQKAMSNIRALTQAFGELPQVVAVVLGVREPRQQATRVGLRPLRVHGAGSAGGFSTSTSGRERGNRQSILGARRRVERSIHWHTDRYYVPFA